MSGVIAISFYIYTRVSTDGQTTDPQSLKLSERYPDAEVISEVASGGKNRPMLMALIGAMVCGDTLIISSLDRLGRKTIDVLTLIEGLVAKGITLISLREGVDYSTIAGRIVTQIMVSIAEMERELISERTKAGLISARAKGSKLGRPTRIDRKDIDQALADVDNGLTISAAARSAGISDSYLRKIIGARKNG